MARTDPYSFVRNRRTVEVAHNEAFQRMLYRARHSGVEAWVWNSRDGIAPPEFTRDGLTFVHLGLEHYKARWSAVLPTDCRYVITDYDRKAWDLWLWASWEAAHKGQDLSPFANDFAGFKRTAPFEPGLACIVDRNEWLASTETWQGKWSHDDS